MAVKFMYEYLPTTASYIDEVFKTEGRERGGHHNHVAEQKFINSPKRFCDMSDIEKKTFDDDLCAFLKRLDRGE